MGILESIENALGYAVGIVWNWPVVILCLGAGLFFTVRFGFVQFRGFFHAWKVVLGKYDHPGEPGDISHLQALSAAVSGTVGLGNIAGVAVAIKMGGPGAVFWMMLIGLVGMATKFAECTLSTHFRHEMEDGELRGGPMYYIVDGLGPKWKPLAVIFAFLCLCASFGGGNMFQSNQTAQVLNDYFGISPLVTGLVLSGALGMVIIGGIKRIGAVAGVLVPFMCISYVLGALIICFLHIGEWGSIISMVLNDAFALKPLAGGTLGSVIIMGVRRAIFSSESGLGSAPIAHAAARTDVGIRQGVVALLEPFIDTIVVCSATSSVILLSGAWHGDADGVSLTVQAFDYFYHGFGSYFVSTAVVLFAFSTAISWSYYGVVSTHYLFGRKWEVHYKVIYVIAFFIGAVWKLGPVINFSDLMLGLMAVPNIITLLLLSGKVKELSTDYFDRLKAGEFDQNLKERQAVQS